MAFILNPKSDLLKNTGNFNTVTSPAKFAPLIAAALPALMGGGAAAAGGAAVAGGGAAAAAGGGAAAAGGAGGAGEAGKIMNMLGKAKGGSSEKPAKEKTKPKFYTEDEDSYYGE
jgi:hypothetical protein